MKKFLVALMVILFTMSGVAQNQAMAQDQGQPQDQGQVQDQGQPQDQGQAPAADSAPPAVARISLIHGNVSTKRGDSGDWNAATLNTPVMNGDTVSTGDNARAEIQLDYANVLRLDQNSAATVANLSNSQIQIQLAQGLASFAVLRGSNAAAEIDTPNAAVHPLKEGDYRIEVSPGGVTRVILRGGSADVTTPQGSTRVDNNEMITVQGTDNPQYQIVGAPSNDQWDKFNRQRDKLILNAQSVRQTDPYYVGTQDLDAYGHWSNVPGYNGVWYPNNVPADWTPYSSGRWVWEPYYGWTWVSYEPWGWAPYHYGRWLYAGGGWGWWPGPVYGAPFYQPIWAPAYVSFFGFGFGGGFGFGLGFGFGSFGWLPLGPGDFFFPWWGGGFNRVNIVNITNIRNIRNVRDGGNGRNGGNGHGPIDRRPPLRAHGVSNISQALSNRNVRAAISRMPAKDFGKSSVPRQSHNVSASDFRGASAITNRMPVVPTKASLRSVDRSPSRGSVRAGASANGHFFSKSQPVARTQPFSRQASQVQKMVNDSRSTYNGSQAKQGQTLASNAHPSAPAGRGTNPAASPAGRSTLAARGSTPGISASGASAAAHGSAPQPGWHSFGSPGRSSSQAGTNASGAHNTLMKTGATPNFRQATQRAQGPSQTPGQRPPAGSTNQPGRSNPPSSNGGWHSFQPRTAPPSGNSFRGASGTNRGSSVPASNGGWHAFQPRSAPPSSAGAGSRAYGGRNGNYSSRPPLDLHQPIVRPRTYSGPSGTYRGPSGPSTYGGSNGGYRGPSGGGYRGPSGSGYPGPSGGGYHGPSGGGYHGPSGGGYRGGSGGGGYHGGSGGGGYHGSGGGGHSGGSGGHGGGGRR